MLLRPAWLSHHTDAHAERCVRLGGLHLCRRCLALWPACFAVIVLGLARGWPLASAGELAAWLVPPLAEYFAVHALGLPYRARRVWPLGAALGAGLGRAFHRYLLDPGDPVAWTVLGGVALAGGVSLALGRAGVSRLGPPR